MTIPKFPLGRTLITPGARNALADVGELLALFDRHQAGDWGEVDEHDRQENELSLREGFRLMSVYTLPNGVKLWVITEADRSATTALLPEEY